MDTAEKIQAILADPERRVDVGNFGVFLKPAPRIVCKDGFSVSVQASDFTYCYPRHNEGPWDEVELGFPSEIVPELLQYAENKDEPTNSVYGYVPIEVVVKVLESHGGIV